MENQGNGGIKFTIRAGDFGTWVLVILSTLGIVSTVLWSYFSVTDRLSMVEGRMAAVETKVSALERAVYELQNRSGHK